MSGSRERVLVALALLAVAILLGVGSPTPWTGAGFLLAWGTFFLAGRAFLPSQLFAAPLRRATLAAGLGLTVAVTAWSLSAYFAKGLSAGTLGLLICAALGLRRTLVEKPTAARPPALPRGVLASVVASSLALGLYLEGYNEIVRGAELVYSFRWDWEAHLFWASLVREQGLPLVGTAGAPEAPFERLMHTGLLCSLAGIEQMTGTTLYQAARILAVGAFALLALSALAMAQGALSSRPGLLLASLAPLVWGSLSLPFDLAAAGWRGATDPYSSGAYPFAAAAGAMYHNLTQLESVALAAAALVAIPAGASGSWTLAAVVLGGAGLVKPTTWVALAPPLLAVAWWARAGRREVGGIVAAFVASGLLFALPALLADLPAGVPSELRLAGLASLWSVRTLVWLGLSGFAASVWIARGSRAAGREVGAGAVVLGLACAAGLALSAVWSEPGRRSFANDSWGLNAALVLMTPLAVATVLTSTRTGLRRAGGALLALQLASGTLYALHYPWLQRHALPLENRLLIERIRSATAPGTRLFVDMSLLGRTGYPYLARPTPLPVHLVQTAERYDGEAWRLVNRGEDPPRLAEFLARREAVVTGPWTQRLRRALRATGWRPSWTEAPAQAQLWLRADTRRGARRPDGPQ